MSILQKNRCYWNEEIVYVWKRLMKKQLLLAAVALVFAATGLAAEPTAPLSPQDVRELVLKEVREFRKIEKPDLSSTHGDKDSARAKALLRDFRRADAAINKGDVETRVSELNHALVVIAHLQSVLDFEHGADAAIPLAASSVDANEAIR